MAEEIKDTSTESTETTTPAKEVSKADDINKMYDENITKQTATLESNRDTALGNIANTTSTMQSSYETNQNRLAAEFDRQKLNDNTQATRNHLNAGNGSQANLYQRNSWQNAQTTMQKSKTEQEKEQDRLTQTIREQYSAKIQEAAAQNDYKKMAALYQEGVRTEEQTRTDAETKAALGDFTGYKDLYGEDTSKTMQKVWALQNPDTAYNLGYITADEYYKQTGNWPHGYDTGGGWGGWWGGGYSSSGSGLNPISTYLNNGGTVVNMATGVTPDAHNAYYTQPSAYTTLYAKKG